MEYETSYYVYVGSGYVSDDTRILYRLPHCEVYLGNGKWEHNENAAGVYIGDINIAKVTNEQAARIMQLVDEDAE